jgi:hypothetical protein
MLTLVNQVPDRIPADAIVEEQERANAKTETIEVAKGV